MAPERTRGPVLYGCLLVLVSWLSLDPASAQNRLDLTTEEVAWRDANPIVDIAVDNDFAPINFVRNDDLQGMAVDLLGLIESKTGFEFRIRTGPWAELIAAAIDHDVDAIINADITPERAERLLFTDVYYQAPQAIVVQRGTTGIHSFDDLNGRTVSLLAETSHVDFFRTTYPDVSIHESATHLERFDSLVNGDADAIVASLPVINHIMEMNLLSAFTIVGIEHTETLDNLRIAVRNSAPELRGILNKGIAAISDDELSAISRKWLPPLTSTLLEQSARPRVDLTPEEAEWLRRNPVIRVAADRAWPPVEYVTETGTYEGISVDYLAIISDMLDVEFVFDTEMTWPQSVKALRDRRLDMFSAAAETPSRTEFATFTEPYLNIPQVLFTRLEAPLVSNLHEMSGEKVAVVEGYAVAELIRRGFPSIDIVEVGNILSGIDAVRNGHVAAFVGGLMNVGYALRQNGIVDIKVAGQTPFTLNIAMAARSDWPLLHTILQKALDSLPERDRLSIETSWAGVAVELPPDYTRVLLIAALLIIVMLSFWTWQMIRQQRKLQQIQAKTQAAQHEAEIANKAKSDFLASMSHELRTPLNAIVGFAQLLKVEQRKAMPEKVDEYLDNILEGGSHLTALVNQVLDLARIEAGEIGATIEACDPEKILNECVELASVLAQEKHIAVSNNVTGRNVPMVLADSLRLKQVLINLLTNAVKYNREGGTVVVDFAESTKTRTLRLIVTDDGLGIDPAIQHKIFDLFFTNQQDAMTSSEGTGIGLSVSKKLIELMGGQLDFRSEAGRGSTFWVELPVSDSTP